MRRNYIKAMEDLQTVVDAGVVLKNYMKPRDPIEKMARSLCLLRRNIQCKPYSYEGYESFIEEFERVYNRRTTPEEWLAELRRVIGTGAIINRFGEHYRLFQHSLCLRLKEQRQILSALEMEYLQVFRAYV